MLRNILLDDNNMIKLGDLGVSKILEKTYANTFTGTWPYMSPELFKCFHDEGKYTAKTDIWYLIYY